MLKKKPSPIMKTVLISSLTHDASNYIHALLQAGVQPILSEQIEDSNKFDGLILPGGGDISPIFYHQKNRSSQDIHISEDIIQLLLFHRFFEQKKPILGICKGMQLINVALGGSLIQDLPTKQIHAYHQTDRYHNVKTLPTSRLFSLYGANCITNSAHHQAVNKLGCQLSITQFAPDGTTEAIEHLTHPVIGIQWHPERMLSGTHSPGFANGSKLFDYFCSLNNS